MRIASIARNAALLIAAAGIPAVAQTCGTQAGTPKDSGYLKVKADSGRTGVFIDGVYVGPAANFGMTRKYWVAPGAHEIRLSEPRYEDAVTKVTIQTGKTVTLAQPMTALPAPKLPFGTLRTDAPNKFAAVYVNNKFMGHAGEFNNSMQGLMLNPGDYTVKIVPVCGGEGHEEHVKIAADKVTSVTLK